MPDDETRSGEGAAAPSGADKPGADKSGGDKPAADKPAETVEMPAATADTVALPVVAASTAATAAPARGPRWRRIVAVVLVVIAMLLAPLVLEVAWMNHDLLNVDNYVSTVAPLASNPGVQTAVARNLTDQLWNRVDVSGQLSGVLPSWAQVFAGPLSNTLKGYAYQATHAAVSSKAFATVWERANRTAHNQVRNVLLGSPGGAVKSSNGEVSLDLSPLADQIKATLDSKGIHALDSVALPPGSATFVIFRSATLAKAQKTVKVLHSLSVALPLLLIAAWAGAIAVSLRRRRTILQLGFTLALAMVVTLVAYHLGRGLYLNAVTSPQLPRDTAASIFDTLMRGMLGPAKTVLIVGFVIWLGALVMGPAGWAIRVRSVLSGGIDTAGSAAEARGLDLGPFGSWVARHRHALQIAGLARGRRGAGLLGYTWCRGGPVDCRGAAGLCGDRRVRRPADRSLSFVAPRRSSPPGGGRLRRAAPAGTA